jgi:hypothetical protein
MTTTALILQNEAAWRRAHSLLRLCERETGFVISPVFVPTEPRINQESAKSPISCRDGEAREGTPSTIRLKIGVGTLAAGDSLNRKVMR